MAKERVRPLIYRPPPRWYFWTALGAALAIHATAVALSQRREAAAVELPPQPPQVIEATLAPPEPPPSAPKFVPVKAAEMSISRAKALAINSPRPPYPYEARSKRITGSGVIVVHVDAASGDVTDASVAKSTGSSILDDAAVSAFRRWRFRPGTVSKVSIPITFTLTGASY